MSGSVVAHYVTKVCSTRARQVTALRGVSAEVLAGEFVAITGPSGCWLEHTSAPHRRAGHADKRDVARQRHRHRPAR